MCLILSLHHDTSLDAAKQFVSISNVTEQFSITPQWAIACRCPSNSLQVVSSKFLRHDTLVELAIAFQENSLVLTPAIVATFFGVPDRSHDLGAGPALARGKNPATTDGRTSGRPTREYC